MKFIVTCVALHGRQAGGARTAVFGVVTIAGNMDDTVANGARFYPFELLLKISLPPYTRV
jgi:hypothetical protein